MDHDHPEDKALRQVDLRGALVVSLQQELVDYVRQVAEQIKHHWRARADNHFAESGRDLGTSVLNKDSAARFDIQFA